MSSVSNVGAGIPVTNLKPLFRGSDYAKQMENVQPEITDLGNGVVVERRGALFKMTGDAKMSMRARVTAYEAAQAGGKAGQAMFDTYRKTHPEEFGDAAVARDQALLSGKLPESPPPKRPVTPSGERVEVKDGGDYTATGDGPVNVSGGNHVNVTGSARNDFITVLYSATVFGLAGNDRIDAQKRATLDGGDGDDWLSAGRESTLVGGAGNDRLEARERSVLDGGDGDDTLSAYEDSTLTGGAGNDHLEAHERSVLDGGDGDDYLSAYDDSVADGGEGDDRIELANGARITDSGGDNYISAYGNARVTAGAGNDRITAYDGSVIHAGDGFNYVVAGAGSTVTSGTGDDYVRVGRGSEVSAGAGDDRVSVEGQVVLHFNRGDGHDVLDPANAGLLAPSTSDRLSSSTVAFGPGILPGDLSIQRSGDDLVISMGDDSLTLRDVTHHGIPAMTFSDGSTLDADQVQAMAELTAQRLRGASRVYQTQVHTTGTAV